MTDRIVALVDMDCFFVQVEERLNPALKGKPCAVVQYTGFGGGGLIAVNYEARDRGVGRHIRAGEAKKICPEIQLVRVPEANGKADLTKYRDAGCEIIRVLNSFGRFVERASVDEAYIDLTEEVKNRLSSPKGAEAISSDQLSSTFVVGYENDDKSAMGRKSGLETWLQDLYSDENISDPFKDDERRLAVAASIVEEMRAAVLSETSFKCSAGVGHNKVLSKLACGFHKPNAQTVLPQRCVADLFKTVSLKKVRNLGGKLGDVLVEQLKCETMSDVAKYSSEELTKRLGEKTGSWLYNLSHGIDYEPVKSRQLPQSIGCSKNFPGNNALRTRDQIMNWLQKMGIEIAARLNEDKIKNNRVAKLLSVYAHLQNQPSGASRSCGFVPYDPTRIAESAYSTLEKLNSNSEKDIWNPPIASLGLSASKFQDLNMTSAIREFFKPVPGGNDATTGTENSDGPADLIQANDSREGLVDIGSNDGPSTSTEAAASTVSSSPTKQMGFFFSKINEGKIPTKPTPVTAGDTRNGIVKDCPPTECATSGKRKKTTQTHPKREALKASDIDREVLSCLPADIQDEIRSHLGESEARKVGLNQMKAASSKFGILKFFGPKSPAAGPSSPNKANDISDLIGTAAAAASSDHSDPKSASEESKLEEGHYRCEECQCAIRVADTLEHSDFHVAEKLQKEVSGGHPSSRVAGHSGVKKPLATGTKKTGSAKKLRKRGRAKKRNGSRLQESEKHSLVFYE